MMQIRLGYVALPVALSITSSSIVTYSHYKKLGMQKGNEKIHQVILSNINALKEILKYNVCNDITFFRMTCNLIPLGTHPNVNYEVWKRYQKEWNEIGAYIQEHQLRVDLHPDQFCVLNSINKEVVESTIQTLTFYQHLLEAMHLNSVLVLHIGGGVGGKKEAMNRFRENFKRLNSKLQQMIVLENDDKIFTIRNTLELCESLNIPMVLDYHHYKCNHNREKIEDYIERIFATWKDRPENPKIHISSPKNRREKRSHHDYINSDDFIAFLEKIRFTNQDFDVMIEAKMKEEALFRLTRELKYKKEYKFVNLTTFLLEKKGN